jgi:hypothetical protein
MNIYSIKTAGEKVFYKITENGSSWKEEFIVK